MSSRTIGLSFVVIGVLFLAAAIYGASLSEHLGMSAPASDWSKRWLLSSGFIGVAGVVTSGGGVALALGRWWGLLFIAAATALLALYPWLLQLLFDVLYGFEEPNLLETAFFVLATVILVVMFLRKAR